MAGSSTPTPLFEQVALLETLQVQQAVAVMDLVAGFGHRLVS